MASLLGWRPKLLTVAVLILWVFSSSLALAQTPCGDITGPENFFIHGPSTVIVTKPVVNCLDPFDVTTDPASSYTLLINGEAVADGGTVAVVDGRTRDIEYEGQPTLDSEATFLFKHENDDYIYLDQTPLEPTTADYVQYASTYFPTQQQADFYLTIFTEDQATGNTDQFFYDENSVEIFDENTGETVRARYVTFVDNANYYFESVKPLLESGTYTLVIREYEIILSSRSIFDKIKDFILPTAHAQWIGRGPYTYAITFTLTELIPEPTGASSVLFLPGIQASRLYNEDGVLGTEDQLWEPNIASDVSNLAMTASGESVNDIYTRDVLDEIALPLFGTNIYKSFLDMLEDLEDDEVIADSLAFAYDWRYSVEDIVASGTKYENEIKNLLAEVESLASSSFTGKVTVIGHSNGGLLAKVLITELEKLNKENLVDKVVFVGVPQLGTPKAIGVLLHGLDQQKALGTIVDSYVTRDVTKNMPGVYSLLPSQGYFDASGDTLVTTDGSVVSADIAQYGDIDSLSKLNDFVLDNQNLREDVVPINSPSTLNSQLMGDMIDSRAAFDNWLAPAGVEVYEVVGTGVLTIKSFQYRTFPCQSVICALIGYSKPYPVMTKDGDETVVALSAEAYKGTKVKGVVDLTREGAQLFTLSREHADLTESPTVQNFLDSIIRFPYLNETLEVPQDFVDVSTHYVVIGAHSPVDITLQTSAGKRVGIFDNSLLEEVVGSQYFELGGSSYIIIPKETEYELKIKGTDTGVYSLTIDSLDAADVQRNEYTYLGASTTPQMVATFQASSTGFSNIMTDFDGDGDIDLEQTLDGELVIPLPTYTYSSLISEIKLLQLNKLYKSVLLLQVQLAERFYKESKRQLELFTLRNLETTLKLYERKKLITIDQLSFLLEIINYLRK